MEEKRYVVQDFLIGNPVMIDRADNTMTFYKHNIYGQIYNLKDAERRAISAARINGLIRRTNNPDYSFANSFAADGYIYKYLMTPEQQSMCGKTPSIPGYDELIIKTNDYAEAIRAMCAWVYEHEYRGDLGGKDAKRGELLKYCDKYLSGEQLTASPQKPDIGAATPARKTYDRGDR